MAAMATTLAAVEAVAYLLTVTRQMAAKVDSVVAAGPVGKTILEVAAVEAAVATAASAAAAGPARVEKSSAVRAMAALLRETPPA
jgi:hypothetical protein